MGVLNVTPDSFSDGGRWFDHGAAVARGLEMVAQGADVIDVGGESTRPGAGAVDEAEEKRRILPVVSALAPSVRVSVDTRKMAVAEAAIEAGATMINDVSASLWPAAAAAGVAWIAMHMRGEPATMQVAPQYGDVVAEVVEFLTARAREAEAGGVGEIWVDPGIGFGKTMAHNLALLRNLEAVAAIGRPVAIGVSRKTFLGHLALGLAPRCRPGQVPGQPAPVEERVAGSVAAAVWALAHGAAMVRAHDVAETAQAVRLLATPALATAAA